MSRCISDNMNPWSDGSNRYPRLFGLLLLITVEEQMRGRLAQLKAPGTTLASTYPLLNLTLAYFCQLPIIPFDDKANTLFNQLRQQKIRVGTLDLRISAIAMAQNAIVLTRNEQDFSLVPGLKIANWA